MGAVKMRVYLSGMPELRLGLNDKVLFESTGSKSMRSFSSSTLATFKYFVTLSSRVRLLVIIMIFFLHAFRSIAEPHSSVSVHFCNIYNAFMWTVSVKAGQSELNGAEQTHAHTHAHTNTVPSSDLLKFIYS